ncbi:MULTISPECIES: DevR family CRISPR-associated autoregulator [Cyanophyceae]|uniref:DevR family CRISPR-associated autoregulator n=1 Tax=Stenomitos frigidus AS-A4 TaxID=2933935 RepID=A0ABV0KKF5_9CYAN
MHLFGNILTTYGAAANNRGQSEGNLATLQKIMWQGEVHSTVSAEAIRWACRLSLQERGYTINREWHNDILKFSLKNTDFDSEVYADDDIFGFMKAEAAKIDGSDQNHEKPKSTSNNAEAQYQRPKGTVIARRGALEVGRAVSINPFMGDVIFNAKSGEKGRTSLYSTEVHATRYQYGFTLTPNHLKDKTRTLAVLDCLASLRAVGGNHAHFLYDFSPSSLVLRWTPDFAPRLLYCFEEDEDGNISSQNLIRQISSGDIEPEELWAGGLYSEALAEYGVHVFPGVKAAVEAIKNVIAKDLQVSP